MSFKLIPQKYYRLPWSLTDNGISWIEVTTSCNLACEGCYRPKAGGHKSLKQIAEDLAVFKQERKSDCMSVAGGDPLVHPKIVEITKMIKDGGWKPIINTNGLSLTPKLLKELKTAGAFGFTFHIDTSQIRRDSKVKTEGEHNALRQKFAEMLATEGGLACSFNQTVTTETLNQVPDVVKWAQKHPDIVHTIVFILYREPRLFGEFDFYAHGKKVPLQETYEKASEWAGTKALNATDVIDKIRTVDELYEPSAYLNGTEDPNSTKWLLATRIASKDESFGYTSPRFMEWVQEGSRFFRGKYLSYSNTEFLSKGRETMLAFSLFDPKMRQTLKRYIKNPLNILKKLYIQTFTIIQPVDILADGRMNMCDGCPDITVHNKKLYWSCRLEEIKQYGCFVAAAPRKPVMEKRPEVDPPQVFLN
ncbi:MAG: radical SAM protein [Bdellovibrio sp.]|nr:radical SAM protein [Bdellovibrio sp.]